MVATIMLLTPSILKHLQTDFPAINFAEGDDFIWSPSSSTVTFKATNLPADNWALLHETAHAALEHATYLSDIDLLKKEVEAWEFAAVKLGPKYGISIEASHIENQIDSYRDWLHLRSICPTCGQSGLQTKMSHYVCVNCNGSWRVNDARRCSLKRYLL